MVSPKLKPSDLPDAGWTRINIAAIWPSELLPLLEASKELQRSLKSAMARWFGVMSMPPDRPWRYDDPQCDPPVMHARGDGLITAVDERIYLAVEAFDPTAMAYDAIQTLLIDDAGLDLPDNVKALLYEKAEAIWRTYLPRREDAERWRPTGSCHWMIDFELDLARAWRLRLRGPRCRADGTAPWWHRKRSWSSIWFCSPTKKILIRTSQSYLSKGRVGQWRRYLNFAEGPRTHVRADSAGQRNAWPRREGA